MKQNTKISFLMVGSILLFNIFLRVIFVFYGYIATEEGTLIYNQKLAWKDLMPFVHYDAWNSLLNDYLIGWYQFFLPHTLVMQRFVGIFIAIIVFFITLEIALYFKSKLILLLTAVLLTFGSYTYLYFSTIPYSEQTMTAFLMVALYFLAKNFKNKQANLLLSIATGISIALSILVKIQAIPSAVIVACALIYLHRKKIDQIVIVLGSIFFILITFSSPFLIANPNQFLYSFTWPFYADKILIYQQGSQITLSSLIAFLQVVFSNYGIFVLLIVPGTWYIFQLWNKGTKKKHQTVFVTVLLLIGYSFVFTGLIHKPPYASYLYPAVPLYSLLAAYFLNEFNILLAYPLKNIFAGILILILFQNILLFPHFKLIKTSLATIHTTPHKYLSQIAQFIKKNSNPSDEILSFYTPVVIAADRSIPKGFNRDRYSLSLLSENESKKRNLMNISQLASYIESGKPQMVILTSKTKQYLGQGENYYNDFLVLLTKKYKLAKVFDTMNFIEDPKIKKLYIYLKN